MLFASTIRTARSAVTRRAFSAPAGNNPTTPDFLSKVILVAAIGALGWAVVYSKGDNNAPFSPPRDVLNKPGTGDADDEDDE